MVVADVRRTPGREIVSGQSADADIIAVMIVRVLRQDAAVKFGRELIHPPGDQAVAVLKCE